jgi:ATP-dependent DNA helicase DinG
VPEVSAVSRVAGLTVAARAAFEPDGPLARTLPGFEARSGQIDMAEAVASALATGSVLLAEAGTGTGKTLAYLVPAILSRQRVLVSTGTKNLQEQIFFKDLPVLKDALGVPFTATCMKGRGNYLCLHRFDAFRQSPAIRSYEETAHLRILERWVPETETGDRAEVEDLPEDLPFWSDIAATSENCLGADCPRYNDCFVVRMRQRAAESDVVIVNHHLLCADAAVRQNAFGEVIPRCSMAIVDEAHQLEDVATQYFGLAISNYRVEDLVHDTDRAISARLVTDQEYREQISADATRLRDASRRFFATLQMVRYEMPSAAKTGDTRARVRPRDLMPLGEGGAALMSALEALEADIALAKDVPEDVLALGRRAGEIKSDVRFLLRADDPGFVYFVETRARGVFLRASPIDVSSNIRDFLLDRMDSTVLTSATLTVDGSFEYVRGRLGVRHANELKLDSEFDYRRQAILYLPRRLPDPRQPGFSAAAAREIINILKLTSGRAFVLFTSYANLRDVHRLASAELEYPILVQGTAPRSALLRDFKATPHAVLLATASFWQGVDVVGEALSCVIIDKLPFASPGDPVTAARVEAIGARGGSPFGEYQIPLAILTLKQGLGRLIRHRQDRGVLAVLDPRLKTMAYGKRFLASLPPAPITHELGDIARFFDTASDADA